MLNIACGILQILAAVILVIGIIMTPASPNGYVVYFLVAFIALVGVSLLHSGIAHVRKPGRSTAIAVAANAAVLFWFALSGLINSAWSSAYAPMSGVISIAAAYLAYRLVLRPAALRSFPQ